MPIRLILSIKAFKTLTIFKFLIKISKSMNFKLNWLHKQQKLPNRMKQIIFMLGLLLVQITFIESNILATNYERKNGELQNTITGIIKDASTNEPLPGVSIIIEGTTTGTISDVNGKYSIKVDNPDAVFLFSFVGYVTEKIKVEGRTVIDVLLVPDIKKLDEVIVVGYGTKQKSSLTGSVSQIKGDEVLKGRATTNVAASLQGAIPGLTITRTTARPTENPSFSLRGGISTNSADPMILIDGIESYSWELNVINPNDIENVSVLKDAAASIYGARAGGGVILITTKRGAKGKMKVTYNGSVNLNYKGKEYPAASGSEWAQMMLSSDFEDTKYGGTSSLWAIMNFTANEYKRVAANEAFDWNYSGKIMRIDPLNAYQPDIVYGTTTGQKHNISIVGGNENITTMTSLGYSEDRSLIKLTFDGEKKYNFRNNLDYNINKYLTLSTNVSYDHRITEVPTYGIGYGLQDFYIFPLYNPYGNFYDNFGTNNVAAHLVNGGKTRGIDNMFHVSANLKVKLDPLTKGLSFNLKGNIRQLNSDNRIRTHSITLYNWDNTIYSTTGSQAKLETMTDTYTRALYQVYEAFLNYDRTFAEKHHVSALLGTTNELRDNYSMGAYRSGLNYTDLDELSTGDGTTDKITTSGAYKWAFVSYLGRLNYDYQGKYLFETTYRRDGSSRLSKNQRWADFSSFLGAWRISEESFIKNNVNWISNLKLRASWGESGLISGIGNYDDYATMGTGTTPFGTTPALQNTAYISGITDNTRTWERIQSTNLAFDFGFLNDRLNGSFDYFWRKNIGMLIKVAYPVVLGGTAPYTNSGNYDSHGWEFVLNWHDKLKNNLSYNVGLVLSDARTEVTKYPGMTSISAGQNAIVQGKPVNSLYVYRTDGLFQTTQEVDDYLAAMNGNVSGSLTSGVRSGANKLRPGSVRRLDLNGDMDISTADLSYYGDMAPHYNIGINLGFSWKGFDFSAFFQGVLQQYTIRQGQMLCAFYSGWTNTSGYLLGKTWTSSDNPWYGGNSGAKFPIMSRNGNINNWNYKNYNDINVMHNWYIRAKSIQLGYTLPRQLTEKINVDRLRFWVSGENLFDISNIKDGFDPENNSSMGTFAGVEIFSSTISVGVDLTF
jgi:TonB-linked SusC/RagA family outer membrane protein